MNPTSPSRIPATLIPGDGIGPEVVEATVQVLDALGSPFDWDVQQAGMAGVASAGDPLPAATLASIRERRLALKGPLTTPVGTGFRSSNVRLREEFELFGNVRPVNTIVPGRYENIDLVLIRENLGGFYVAHEFYIPQGNDPHAAAVCTGMNTREGSERIARFAFEYAVRHGRKKITVVHKANILKALTGLFPEACKRVAKEYEGRVEVDDMIVDACAMQLVLNPWRFDMLLCTNLFGDILSDQLAGLVGGLGMAPGSNFGRDAAIFEAVHGSAPDIAGKGVANPISLMLAAAMMLEHVGRAGDAQRLKQAISATINADKVATRDLGGTAGTRQFAEAVAGGSSGQSAQASAVRHPGHRRGEDRHQRADDPEAATVLRQRDAAHAHAEQAGHDVDGQGQHRDQRQGEQRAVVLFLQARRDLFLQQPDALDRARHVAQHDGEFFRRLPQLLHVARLQPGRRTCQQAEHRARLGASVRCNRTSTRRVAARSTCAGPHARPGSGPRSRPHPGWPCARSRSSGRPDPASGAPAARPENGSARPGAHARAAGPASATACGAA